jgi:hypothetical protein
VHEVTGQRAGQNGGLHVVLLEVDCTGSMAAGGTKDGTFIANEMCTQCDKIRANFFFLAIFDGASNMQSPTKPLVLC